MDERDYKAMNKDKSTIGFEPVLAPVCNCIVGEIADGRKGYLQRHNYCPKCGIKLNWNELLNGC